MKEVQEKEPYLNSPTFVVNFVKSPEDDSPDGVDHNEDKGPTHMGPLRAVGFVLRGNRPMLVLLHFLQRDRVPMAACRLQPSMRPYETWQDRVLTEFH
jgi:hypothetical protein